MSAQFWTKILTEIKSGANKKQMDAWRKQSSSLEFTGETIYHNDVHASVVDWFTRKKSFLPRSVMKKENELINYHVHNNISKYLDKMLKYGKGIPNIKAILIGKGGGGVEFTFMPTSNSRAGGMGQGKVFKAWNTYRSKELDTMGNNILNDIINDKNIITKTQLTTGGNTTRGGAYSSSSALSSGAGVQDGLHGDLRAKKRTTVAAYGARRGVKARAGSQRDDPDWQAWFQEMKNATLDDYGDFEAASQEFETKLFDWIDEEYGFEVIQDNPIDGSKLKDEYVLISKTRANQTENKRMQRTGADKDKVFDQMISDGVDALRQDMLSQYNSKGFAEGIEASTPLVERGRRAVTKHAMSKIAKATKSNKAVKIKQTGKKPVKGKKYKTPLIKKTGKRKTKDKKRNPKKKKLGLVAAASRGSTRKSVSRNGKGSSPIALMALINKVLPRELMKNMTGVYPRGLENRTGRFRESAQVTQVIPFPKMVEVQYSYMKDPYQVFEQGSGSPLATPGRDPRRIIGGTIREIAQEMMGTKFGLVRTKRM